MRVIGLMSGTSADGVDAAIVDWPDAAAPIPFEVIAHREFPLARDEQQRIHRLAAGEGSGVESLRELVALDVDLGHRFADAAITLARDASIPLAEVAAIASHGQTIVHYPEIGGTLQIGSLPLIAERTGCRVIGDFRPRDIAAGGEGAPLTPFFHRGVFGAPDENRLVLNLGGIANVTWLPAAAEPDRVLAFDVGPANSLLDGVVELLTKGRESMDRDGIRAWRGVIHRGWLERLLEDEYLLRPPPKSTGRERYGRERARSLLEQWTAEHGQAAGDDLLATLVAFTVGAIGRACTDWLPESDGAVERLLVGGGGAENPAVLEGLVAALPGTTIETFDRHGVPAAAAEAMAFSLMGRNALLGLPNHLPRCTGATSERILGLWVAESARP